jgi:two-component system, LytTR family, response regulator
MTLRVLVVDDERPARQKVRAHLAGAPDVEVVGEAATGLEAVELIRRLEPDVVFLDVQMPGLDGFEVVEAVGADEMPAVVFVSAFDEYAIKAFDVEAADYLLKPFDEARFGKALDRVRRRLGSTPDADAPGRMERLLTRVRPSRGYLQRLVVTDRDRVVLVPVGDVYRISAAGNYATLHTGGGRRLVRQTLAHLEDRLDPDRFARIHRSEIVAIDAVKELLPLSHGDFEVVLRSGDRLRLSRRFQHRLLKTDGIE